MDMRERILEAAVQLFAEVGSRGATTRRIAAAAGANEVTLFRHFGSKEALMREALRWASQRMVVSALPAEPQEPERELTRWSQEHLRGLYQARALLRTSMGEFEENPEASTVACEVSARVAAELRGYLVALQERGWAARELDLEAATATLMGTLFTDAISREMMPDRYPFTIEEAARRYVELFLRAIRPPR